MIRLSLLLLFCIFSLECANARPSTMTAALLRAGAACFPLTSVWTPQWANLQGYWKLDETAGASTAADSSANNNAGTAANVTFATAGRIGNAASFNGTTSSIAISGYNANLNTATDSSYTFATWTKITSIPSAACGTNSSICKAMIFGRLHIGIVLANTGQLSGEYYTTGGVWHGFTGATLSTGKWYHLAMVLDNTAKTVQLYVNGVASGAANSFAGLSPYVYGSSAPYVIGMANNTDPLNNGNNAHPYNGVVDETAVWNTALTALQVRTLYDQQSCGKN